MQQPRRSMSARRLKRGHPAVRSKRADPGDSHGAEPAARVTTSLVASQGFAFLPQHRPTASLAEVARDLGTIVDLPGLERFQTLAPCTVSEASANTYSGSFGLSTFPMHTDLAQWYLPPRYLLLRCLVGCPEVSTSLLDGNQLRDWFGDTRLRRILVRPRRVVDSHRACLRILEKPRDGKLLIRWDSLFLHPATDISAEIFLAIEERVMSTPSEKCALAQPGDTLLVDNWRMLHGRESVAERFKHRRIERTYLGALN